MVHSPVTCTKGFSASKIAKQKTDLVIHDEKIAPQMALMPRLLTAPYAHPFEPLFSRAIGGELFDRVARVGHLSEKAVASIIRQVLGGVEYLHSMGICHRSVTGAAIINPKP
jgi:serine/threonine protein kinase